MAARIGRINDQSQSAICGLVGLVCVHGFSPFPFLNPNRLAAAPSSLWAPALGADGASLPPQNPPNDSPLPPQPPVATINLIQASSESASV
jgi:hypothetical protein